MNLSCITEKRPAIVTQNYYPMKDVMRQCIVLTAWLICLALPIHLLAGNIFQTDTIRTHTLNCTGLSDVCIGIAANNLSNYTLSVDGQLYTGLTKGCDFDTIISYSYHTLPGLGSTGPYRLESWVVNGVKFTGDFNNLPALLNMMNQWDPKGNWSQIAASLTIKGGTPGGNYSQMVVTALANNTPAVLGMNFGLIAKGTSISLSTGVHRVVAEDKTSGIKDTLTVVLRCGLKPQPLSVYETIPANDFQFTYSVSSNELSGPPVSITNLCGSESGEFVRFSVNAAKMEVNYRGIKCGGQERACIVICDGLGICDTTYLVVDVDFSLCEKKSLFKSDTVVMNFTKKLCLDRQRLPGKITSVENLCSLESGKRVDFDYDPMTHCVTYTGISTGTEKACYLIVDEYGNQDTTYLAVAVRKPLTGIIIDTLDLGQEKTYCIDISELAGNIINITNLCPAKSGNQLDLKMDALTLCVRAKGRAVGIESACIVLCDNYGVCDTTLISLVVVSNTPNPCANALPPAANNDLASTLLNTDVNIRILGNDLLGSCPNFTITIPGARSINGPKNGLAILNSDNTVDYLPDIAYCGMDTFQYILCNPNACDTATVIVVIDCIPPDSIVVNTGLSPNGDGVNDYFTITNIEKYPENELRVFNRWGAVVYAKRGYSNQWGGSFRKDELPDGTYFYTLRIQGIKEGFYKGYLQILR